MTQEQQAQTAAAAQDAPASLLDQILEASKLKQGDDGYAVTKSGLQEFLKQLVDTDAGVKVSASLVDKMLAELDMKLSSQVNAILHHEDFQKLESSWRGLKFLVDRTDFRQNIRIEFLNVSKEDLLADFEDTPEVTKSGLYKHIYTAEYGQFGGKPVGAMIANYTFGPGTQDISLLQYTSKVAAMSHAPFLASTDKSFFGIDSWEELPNLKDLNSIFEMPQYTKWRGFRETEDARYVGLTMPRFLLRTPYGPDTVPAKNFTFKEDANTSDDFCWGNSVFAFASRLTESFASYRWCTNIIGPQGGGTVDNLPIYNYESMGEIQTKIPRKC